MNDRQRTGAVLYDWRLPWYAVTGACAVFLPGIYYFDDIRVLFYDVLAAPMACLALLAFTLRKRGLRWVSVTSTLGIFALVSWTFVARGYDLHRTVKWSLEGQRYKAQAREAPTRNVGDLQHVEWDGWGWLGQDTMVYLVFDPNDMLLKASQEHSSGTFPGIPCKVYNVTQLEPHYYSVLFYTETSWDDCTY
jgi:hypothetical protein